MHKFFFAIVTVMAPHHFILFLLTYEFLQQLQSFYSLDTFLELLKLTLNIANLILLCELMLVHSTSFSVLS